MMPKSKYKVYRAEEPDLILEVHEYDIISYAYHVLNGKKIMSALLTAEVIDNLRDGKWVMVKSKRKKQKTDNLFDIDDL